MPNSQMSGERESEKRAEREQSGVLSRDNRNRLNAEQKNNRSHALICSDVYKNWTCKDKNKDNDKNSPPTLCSNSHNANMLLL